MRRRRVAERPGRVLARIAGIEQDRAAGFEIAIDALGGAGRGRRLLRRHRPIEQREEDELVALDINGKRLRRLDGGAPVQRIDEADQPRAALGIDGLIPGLDISETQLRGRLHDKTVIRMRR